MSILVGESGFHIFMFLKKGRKILDTYNYFVTQAARM